MLMWNKVFILQQRVYDAKILQVLPLNEWTDFLNATDFEL